VLVHNGLDPGRYFFDGLFPGYLFKSVPDLFQRMCQTLGMVLIGFDIQAFAADITFAARVILVSPDLDDLIAFDSNLKSADITSQYTCCFFHIHFCHSFC